MSDTIPGSASIPAQSSSPSAPARDLDAPPPAVTRNRNATVRNAIHAGTCALSGVLITVGFALDNTDDVDTGAEILAVVTAEPDRFYWSNIVGAFGLVMVAAVGLAVLRLVRGRGRVAATVGGLLLMIGAPAAAAGQAMYAAIVTTMAESGLDTAVMAALQDAAEDSARTGLTFMVGFPSVMLGLLVSAGALLVSRAVPRWVPIALVAGVVAIFALGDTAAASVADALLAAAFVGIGWALLRPARTG